MMSVAGGWFFLIACEMFVLGNRDLRLRGLGSYLQTAANEGNTRAIAWGLAMMIGVIVLMDQIIWRPVIAWAEKFKFEQVEAAEAPRSPVLNLLKRSRILPLIAAKLSVRPARERLSLYFCAQARVAVSDPRAANHELDSVASGRRSFAWHHHSLCKNEHSAWRNLSTRTQQHSQGCGRHIFAGRADARTCGPLDNTRRSNDRAPSEAIGSRATTGANSSLCPGNGIVPDHTSRFDPGWRRTWDRIDRAAVARNAMVCAGLP